MNKMLDILDEITRLAETELNYLVDPRSPSPIDWPKYPVMFIDSVEETGDDTKIVSKVENTLDITVAIFVKDNSRRGRIKKVTQEIANMTQFIYRNETLGCLAINSSYLSSQTVWTTDTDNIGAALVKFSVTYRESIP